MIIHEIPFQSPIALFALFAEENGAVFLDSVSEFQQRGRYSFIAVDPFQIFIRHRDADTLHELANEIKKFPVEPIADLPPFQGGVAGFFSYELAHSLEKLPETKIDDMQFPDLAVGFYDVVIGFDAQEKRAWIFSTGYPLQDTNARQQRAGERLRWLLNRIAVVDTVSALPPPVCGRADVKNHFSQESYQQAVARVIEYILDGDIFEANISQRFLAKLPDDYAPFDLYRRLRVVNPAPFSAFVKMNDVIIASASPERFLKLSQDKVETRPIKGTRPRGKNKIEDEKIAQQLLASEKDHAENTMIVDLLRNDLSRVCEPHSVKVPVLCGLESYATVHHLVSVVTGKLRQDVTAIDLLCAAFPGGSITGAPKIRAMEIIAEIEPTARGPYCGSVGYIGFNGEMDLSIAIRTFAIKNNQITFQVGGAVVADSDPLEEYEETLTKARGMFRALVEPL